MPHPRRARAISASLIALVLCFGAPQAHAQLQRQAPLAPHVAASDALLAPGGSAGLTAFAAGEPALPITISPLRIEGDPNGINLDSGKTRMTAQLLAVPGAPRLRFDRVQNVAPYLSGRQSGAAGESVLGSFSVHTIDGVTESFSCVDFDCQSLTGSGSFLNQNTRLFVRGNSGERYTFNLKHVVTTGTSPVTIQYYASSITYPDGEVLSFTYDTATLPGDPYNRTWYRPTRVASSLGFHLTISYQPGAVDTVGWGQPAVAAIYHSSDPSSPLGQLTYHGDGVTVTPRAGMPLVGSVTRDGVVWSYSYLNTRYDTTTQGYVYDRVTVTGPNGYNVVYAMRQVGGRNVISTITDSLGRVTTLGYDSTYRPTQSIAPEGDKVAVAYDMLGNITTRTATPKAGSGLVAVTETAGYPSSGCDGTTFNLACFRPLWFRDGLSRQTDFLYNSQGQLIERTDPADASGVRRKTYITYETTTGLSRPSVVRVCGDVSTCGTADEIRTEYEYWGSTALPSVVRQVDAARGEARVTLNTYDLAGRLRSADGPLPGNADATYYRYDVHGRKRWEIGPADLNGLRVASKFTPRDSDDKIMVVAEGSVASESSLFLNPLRHTVNFYDDRRNLRLEETRSAAGTAYVLTQRTYDDRARLTCEARRMNPTAFVSPPADACTLGASGDFGPDRITRNVYDAAGQLYHLSENGASTLATLQYDEYHRRARIDRDTTGAGTVNDVAIGFSYNPASQIAARSQTNDAYEYPVTSASSVYAPANGRNQYTQITGTGAATPAWDANGTLTSDGLATGPTTYAYDAENRLTGVSGAKSATLAYDPLGRLYQVSSGGVTSTTIDLPVADSTACPRHDWTIGLIKRGNPQGCSTGRIRARRRPC